MDKLHYGKGREEESHAPNKDFWWRRRMSTRALNSSDNWVIIPQGNFKLMILLIVIFHNYPIIELKHQHDSYSPNICLPFVTSDPI